MPDASKFAEQIAVLEDTAKHCLSEDISWLQLNKLGSGSSFGEQALKWQGSPRYFTEVKISSLALMRMAEHAQNGGTQEVMGVLTGVIRAQSFVVLDCFALPVEATETRVNAMAEGYEFMVQYLQSLQALGRTEHIVGWYHSHPGYGCWLSGIDVRTQMQNQAFQDPFVALVIDPVRTAKNSLVEIGAFRTFPDALGPASQATQERPGLATRKSFQEPQPLLQPSGSAVAGPGQGAKYAEFGAYADAYYPLAVSYFSLPPNDLYLSSLENEDWIAKLTGAGGERASARALRECTRSAQELACTVTETAHSLANGQNNAQPPPQSAKIQRLSDHNTDVSLDQQAKMLGSGPSSSRRHQLARSVQSNYESISQRLTASLNDYGTVTARARSTASERELRRELFRG